MPQIRRTSRRTRGFDFTGQMHRLCADAAARLEELTHIDMRRIAVTFCQTRRRVLYGLQAKLTPLRFEGGKLVSRQGGRNWTVERLYDDSGCEMLYVLSFYLPRFMDQPFEEKLTTIFHELWHVSPQFDGDLRRHSGRCYAHTHSQRQYDEFAAALGRKWLNREPPRGLYSFLADNFEQLFRRHDGVYGLKLRAPRLIPAETAPETNRQRRGRR